MDYQTLHTMVTRALERLDLPQEPKGLYDPIRYALSAGGKRLRPVLTLAVCQALDRNAMDAIHQAIALEVFHNFTLLHDDVMDKADMRRGLPTVHRKWNENTAILSGDAMLTTATMLLQVKAGMKLPAALNLFNTTAMGVYEGQQLDMDFEHRWDVTMKEYIQMIRLKTSILLGCACSMGALMADCNPEMQAMWFSYGENLGLAFQLQDDYLDTFGNADTFGKTIGGDIANNKKTWLLVKALELAPDRVKPLLNLSGKEKYEAVSALYRELEIPEMLHTQVESYISDATSVLDEMGLHDADHRFFYDLAIESLTRKS